MARLALVKVGDVHLSPRGIRAVEAAQNGSFVVYVDGARVAVLDLDPDAIVAALSEAIGRGVGSGWHPGGAAR